MTTYLYWIHYPQHSDPMTEGYIGITKDPKRRLQTHKCNPENRMVKGALKKGAKMSIIGEFNTEKNALTEEVRMRPTDMIGWNLTKGGGKPPAFNPTPENRARISAQWKGYKQSEEHVRKRMERGRIGKKHSPEAKEKMRQKALERHVIRVSCVNCKRVYDRGNFGKHIHTKCLTNS